MTATILPDLVRPSMADAGREADRVLDRLLGRWRPPIWPWLATMIVIVAIGSTLAALVMWSRRPGWSSPEPGADQPGGVDDTSPGVEITAAFGETSIGQFEADEDLRP